MKYKKSEHAFILRWAKKIKLINILGGECEKCENKNIFQLEFHHEEEKEKNINELINKGKRWSNIYEEGKKCKILCRNCHMEHHSSLNSRHELRKRKLLNERLCCERCNYSGINLSSLDFHHKDPKTKKFNISDLISRKISVNLLDLEKELEKCEIVCRNCHILETINHDSFLKLKKDIYDEAKKHKQKPKVNSKKIIELYKQGVRQKDIVKTVGCAKSTVSYTIKNLE